MNIILRWLIIHVLSAYSLGGILFVKIFKIPLWTPYKKSLMNHCDMFTAIVTQINSANIVLTFYGVPPTIVTWGVSWVLRLVYELNPLTAGAHIFGFPFLLTQKVPHLKYIKAKMWHQPARFEKSWPLFFQIWIIFTHLKLWIASARHNLEKGIFCKLTSAWYVPSSLNSEKLVKGLPVFPIHPCLKWQIR